MTNQLKYVQVREHLRKRVRQMAVGTLLPAEPVLCTEYDVSRITLRKAIDGLVSDGLLVREQGRGTFVAEVVVEHKYSETFVNRIAGFHSVMTGAGHAVGTEVLTHRVVPATPAVAAELGLQVADEVIELVRLRSVDGTPNHMVHTFLPAETFPAVAGEDFSEQSLYAFLREEYHADLHRARLVVEVGLADREEATRLGVDLGSPLLVVRSTVLSRSGTPIVSGFSRLKPDVSQVELEVVADDNSEGDYA